MGLSRKRKKELRKLQEHANHVWESQQELIGDAAHVAREAGRQLGNYGREQVVPQVQETYGKYAQPYVDQGVRVTRDVLHKRIVPAAGAVVGSAMSVWDAAHDTRERFAAGRGLSLPDSKAVSKKADKYSKGAVKKMERRLRTVENPPKRVNAGGVIAIILGAAAAIGVAYAAWQTLRADDELWVADDPLQAPDA